MVGLVAIRWPEIRSALWKIDLKWAVTGVVVFYINYLFRAIRLVTLLRGRISFWPDALWVACFHGFMTYLLPMRTGDLSLPILLKTHYGLDLLEAGRVLVKARMLDLMSLGGITLIAAVGLPAPITPKFRFVWASAGTLMALLPWILPKIVRFRFWEKFVIFRRVAEVGNATRFQFSETIWSFAIWMAVSGGFYCAARAIELPIGLGGVLFLVTVQLPLQLLPVQGIANAGNHEGGWITALSLLGIPAVEALRFALTSHALLLIYVLSIFPALIFFRYFFSRPHRS